MTLIFFHRSGDASLDQGGHIHNALCPASYQAIEIVLRSAALSEQYTHKCAKRYARATQSAWTLPQKACQ